VAAASVLGEKSRSRPGAVDEASVLG
jgi:hypothetical protein